MYNLLLYARTKISRPCAKTERSFQTFAKRNLRRLIVSTQIYTFFYFFEIYIFLNDKISMLKILYM